MNIEASLNDEDNKENTADRVLQHADKTSSHHTGKCGKCSNCSCLDKPAIDPPTNK